MCVCVCVCVYIYVSILKFVELEKTPYSLSYSIIIRATANNLLFSYSTSDILN